MQPEFRDVTADYGSELRCPSCGECNLHHTYVEIYDREEDKRALHVAVMDGRVHIDQNDAENPSRRRSGIRIGFTCEHCPTTQGELVILQHKGVTFVDFLWPVAPRSHG